MLRTLSAAVVAAFVVSSSAFAQGLEPIGRIHSGARKLDRVPAIAVPALDRNALADDDEQRRLNGQAPRFAVPHAVAVDAATAGAWDVLDATWSLWRLRIQAPEASHVNLGFTRLVLPSTARLMVYSADYQNVVRPFDAADVSPEGELWTPVVSGSEIVVELYVTTAQRPAALLHLGHIGSGYRFFGAGNTAVGVDDLSGSCNVDVACPAGSGWASEIPAVAAISTGGSVFCTGFMVNNTAQDGRNFFMTANHCGITSGNAASLVCYWNYQRAVCGSGQGPMTMFNTGATFRSSYSTSDFTLVELNSAPNPAWGITYAGWNRSTADATSACGIHHPSGDQKKISFENQATTTTSYNSNTVPGNGSHVRVIDWDIGTTEGGSSGSPLFDQNHRVIGQLHGGGAACGNNLSDWYGRFSMSWTGGGTNSSRLSNWLDPLNSGAVTLDTRGSSAASASVYGSGCYTSYRSFYEQFPGAVDLAGTASSTSTLAMAPNGAGYTVSAGPNAWFTPTSANLGLTDDSLSSARTLPFSFPFPGGSTTSLRVCSNGFVWLNGTSTDTDYTPTVAELCANPARLAALWTDLNPATAGTVHYDVDPSNSAVYCTWLAVPAYGSTGTAGNSFQIVLRSSGAVELRYRQLASTPAGALVGWSPGNGAVEPPARDLSLAMPFATGADAAGLTFTPNNRPVVGTTLQMTIGNIPAGTVFGGVFLGWSQVPAGIDLAGIGMPGCSRYCSQEFAYTVMAASPSHVFQFGVPAGATWHGIRMFAQAATLSTGFNSLGALSSNGIELLFNPN